MRAGTETRAVAPLCAAETVSAENQEATDTTARAVAEVSCAYGKLRALLWCPGSVLESALCSWAVMVKAAQSSGLPQRFSHRCVHEGSAKPWEVPGATGLFLPRVF